jgi:hypothetical protein
MSQTDTETKLVEKLKEWYLAAADTSANRDWRQRAAKCLRVYNGSGQWDESVKMLLESQSRPALTINRILPTVNVVWGNLIQNRTELRLQALHRGTKEIANLGSALLKHAMDCCQGYDSSSDAFRDGIITGKGWTTADHIYDRDPLTGELVVEAPNPLFVYEDPRNTDYDANKGEYIFRERFWTANKLKAYFPNKYKEAMAASVTDWFQPVGDDTGNSLAGLIAFLNDVRGGSSSLGGDGEMAGVVVREAWWKEYKAVRMASISLNGQTKTGRIERREDVALLEQVAASRPEIQVKITNSVICTLKVAVLVGDLLLRREEDPLNGCKAFPYTRFSPYWLHGDSFGVVDNLVGPQEELNKSRSNLLHDANLSGNPAWRATNANTKGEATIRQFGSAPGVLLNEKDFGGKIERIEPGGLSPAHAQLSEQNAADIQEISGANPNLMGTPTERVESGRARLIQQEAGLKVLAPVMGNFFRSQSIMGEMLWDFIRHNGIYSPEEIQAVVDIDIINALGGMGGLVEAMNRWDTGAYAVKAVPSKTTSTWRDVQLEEVKQLAEMIGSLGLAMPPDVANSLLIEVLELSSFPGSSKIAERLKQQPAMPVPPEIPGGQGTKQGTRYGAVVASSGGQPY